MTELVTTTDASTLAEEMRYAQAVTVTPERGATSLLPKAYQGSPANVLIAIGLGKAIGIAPAQALYEIYVVNGRPSPSANLMAALVRRAGHRLRIQGDAETCTAELVRSDDPEYPFRATWTIAQAKAAGLAGKDTWKAYPAAMLRSRAISEVVRMGAPEAVIGMDYSAEEMRDVVPSHVVATPTVTAADFTTPAPAEDVQDAEEVHEPQKMTARTRGQLFSLMSEQGWDDDTQRAWLSEGLGRPVESRASLTEDEALQAIDVLRNHATQPEATS